MSHRRRYSDWLLNMEERLTKRRDGLRTTTIIIGVVIGLIESLLPWQGIANLQPLTDNIPWWAHCAVAAVLLPIVYFVIQNDYNRKVQVFTHAMDDLGRRLVFLDPSLEPEQFELLDRYHPSILRPTHQSISSLLPNSAPRSLRLRVGQFFRDLPSPVMEEHRFGWLSILHPKTVLSWVVAIVAIIFFVPGWGLWSLGGNQGLTGLVLLLPLYLVAAHANARFAYEQALYDWLRMG